MIFLKIVGIIAYVIIGHIMAISALDYLTKGGVKDIGLPKTMFGRFICLEAYALIGPIPTILILLAITIYKGLPLLWEIPKSLGEECLEIVLGMPLDEYQYKRRRALEKCQKKTFLTVE